MKVERENITSERGRIKMETVGGKIEREKRGRRGEGIKFILRSHFVCKRCKLRKRERERERTDKRKKEKSLM